MQTLIRRDSFETLKREFEPAICLEYIKAGVEAIIEDEVTSRFEAEELKVDCWVEFLRGSYRGLIT